MAGNDDYMVKLSLSEPDKGYIRAGYREFRTAIVKLGKMGKGFACRDCPSLAQIPHRLGGFVCEKHKPVAYPPEVDDLWHARKGA